MKKFAAGTLVVGAVLSLAMASALAQTIRRAENLPEPVAADQRVDVSELDAKLADANVVLLDVREPWELEKLGTREGYINIPIAELADRLDELPKEKTILTA